MKSYADARCAGLRNYVVEQELVVARYSTRTDGCVRNGLPVVGLGFVCQPCERIGPSASICSLELVRRRALEATTCQLSAAACRGRSGGGCGASG